ncbi:hypothetical protein F5890DRAFT_1560042 [Lentinula detonsa]|uniref:CxC2-like cysteine cluster KDZ transposase-associated domain-containing protein n=1 Tax=Lentinula detonsa TaxID=2804962 RepID=A0AA38PN96_9AGAR|nr:hypothetical protein F5890DRAFT_1560042 [Lentinula detonsa]
MPARKFRKISSQELEQNTSAVHSSSERRHVFTVVNGSQSHSTTSYSPKRTPVVIAEPPTASFQSKAQPAVNSTEIPPDMETPLQLKEEVETQRAKLLEEYSVIFDDVLKLLVMKEADSRIGTPCCCGSAPREVRCESCEHSVPFCRSCWVEAHRHTTSHWAQVWDSERGFFVRHDISTVLNNKTFGIPLGHEGSDCPNSSNPLLMTLVRVNGVHATRVAFCGCASRVSKWRQLFDANLFPATCTDPQSAFSFDVLNDWHLSTLQGKTSAYDFVRKLRRLSDNVFTGNVPDPIKQFMFVARIWTLLKAEKRSGKAYLGGMNILNPSRPKDTVQVLCPICPEAGVNVPPQWLQQPPALRHLYSQHFCLDGNMKLINYGKKNDSHDVSLFAGRAYMAEESSFKHYLATVPQIQKDKAICNHLKVVNSANRAKFKNMSVTGVVTCQCDHGFIWSSVDLVRGENHASVDLALKLAVASRPFNDGEEPDRIGSYDNMCSLCVHIVDRWRKYHPSHAKDVEKMRWTIPACHVRNHIVGCEYLYSYLYKPFTGHFHGESVEKPWANLNALGPSVQQMSPGHRIDTLIDQYSDWNQRKVVGAARQLLKEIDDAKVQYVRKRDHFVGLCQLYRGKVEAWTAMNRSPHVDPQSKRKVISVYSHNDEKAPTLKALVDSMMASKDVITVPSGNESLGAAWKFLEFSQGSAPSCKP